MNEHAKKKKNSQNNTKIWCDGGNGMKSDMGNSMIAAWTNSNTTTKTEEKATLITTLTFNVSVDAHIFPLQTKKHLS